ncbi:MAG: ABC transporter permease [Actinomyces sp.]|nr:MAG: ABC transporter permease [Actinomyces sp.]
MRFLAQRLGQLLLVLFAVTFLTFASVNILGDPLTNILGPLAGIDCEGVLSGQQQDISTRGGTSEGDCAVVERTRQEFHLDDPIPIRYVRWVGDIATGDLGDSFQNQQPVTDIIGQKLPITLWLVFFAMVLSLALSIPWAIASAYRANRRFDNVSTVASFGLLAIPNFAMGVILFYLFAVRWGWFPTRYEDATRFDQLRSLVLPALTLALPLAASYQRLLRTDLITTLQEDYIHMARAKGLPDRTILLRHALRPSMFSIITVFGINTGALIGGSLVIEQIFSVPGIGRELVTAVVRDDPPVVLGIIVIVVIAFVVINLIVDLLYSFLDPRVRSV